MLTPVIEPSELGDHLAQRLRLPARPVVAAVVGLQRVDEFGEQWRPDPTGQTRPRPGTRRWRLAPARGSAEQRLRLARAHHAADRRDLAGDGRTRIRCGPRRAHLGTWGALAHRRQRGARRGLADRRLPLAPKMTRRPIRRPSDASGTASAGTLIGEQMLRWCCALALAVALLSGCSDSPDEEQRGQDGQGRRLLRRELRPTRRLLEAATWPRPSSSRRGAAGDLEGAGAVPHRSVRLPRPGLQHQARRPAVGRRRPVLVSLRCLPAQLDQVRRRLPVPHRLAQRRARQGRLRRSPVMPR